MQFQRTFRLLVVTVNTLGLAFNGLGLTFNALALLFGRSFDDFSTRLEEINQSTGKLLKGMFAEIVPSQTIADTQTKLESLKGMMNTALGNENGGVGNVVEKTKQKVGGLAEKIAEVAQQAQAPLDQFKQDFKTTGTMIGDTIVSSMKKFEDTLVDGLMSGKFAFEDFANFVIKELLRIAIKKLIIDKITGGFTSFLGGLGGVKGAERGGTVTANRPYLVGEAGAELFVPNKTGTIVPNNRLGGGMGSGGMPVNITYNIQAFDSRDTLQAITENAPTISAIIETEFNKRGRRGFVT